MFETVAPEQFVRRSRRSFYEALPFSLTVHALAGVAVLVGSVWTVVFPLHSPAQSVSFNVADVPPPPPPPPPPRAVAQQVARLKQVEVPREVVAPLEIPDEIPIVDAEPVVAAVPEGVIQGVDGGLEGGQIGGVLGGVIEGEAGGSLGGVIGGVKTDGVVEVERDKPLGLFPLSQVYPSYPEKARLNAWEDQMVVRYTIGKDGRVKDVVVLDPPQHELFIDPTVRAIRSWRFRPLIKDGQRQEVVHELTINYRLVQES